MTAAQLTEMTLLDPDGGRSLISPISRYQYDADGAGSGGFTEKYWIYDGDEAILEFSSAAATAPSHRYLWGPAVDQLLADEQVATGSPNDVRWPLSDWQGTVRDVATYNAATNVTTIANHNALAWRQALCQASGRWRIVPTTRRSWDSAEYHRILNKRRGGPHGRARRDSPGWQPDSDGGMG